MFITKGRGSMLYTCLKIFKEVVWCWFIFVLFLILKKSSLGSRLLLMKEQKENLFFKKIYLFDCYIFPFAIFFAYIFWAALGDDLG